MQMFVKLTPVLFWLLNLFFLFPSGAMAGFAVIQNSSRLWPSGRIPYVVEEPIESSILEKVLYAMKEWEAGTHGAIRFVPITGPRPSSYLIVRKTPSNSTIPCLSRSTSLGRAQTGPTYLEIETLSCGSTPAYLQWLARHELGHVIGLTHEHQRPDRDRSIIVYLGNIPREAWSQMHIITSSELMLYTAYDTTSIMHYPSKMHPKAGGIELTTLGGRPVLLAGKISAYDFYTVAQMYLSPSPAPLPRGTPDPRGQSPAPSPAPTLPPGAPILTPIIRYYRAATQDLYYTKLPTAPAGFVRQGAVFFLYPSPTGTCTIKLNLCYTGSGRHYVGAGCGGDTVRETLGYSCWKNDDGKMKILALYQNPTTRSSYTGLIGANGQLVEATAYNYIVGNGMKYLWPLWYAH